MKNLTIAAVALAICCFLVVVIGVQAVPLWARLFVLGCGALVVLFWAQHAALAASAL